MKIKRYCKVCQKIFFVKPSVLNRGKGLFCSKSCAHLKENNLRWKGGKFINNQGYIFVKTNNFQRTTRGYERQHRIVVENQLGIELTKDQIIHHINGNKIDNRIENLQITTKTEHPKIHKKIRESR